MVVVVVLPRTDLLPDLAERREQGFVQQLIAEPSVKALHEAILDLSRFRSGQVLMLGGLAFEGHGAFPTQR
jgi:hypothetical protein